MGVCYLASYFMRVDEHLDLSDVLVWFCELVCQHWIFKIRSGVGKSQDLLKLSIQSCV
jgi:hypothetical protein